VAPLIYLLFFLSGAASLVYQVAWVRSLTLVFGGTHLAVTTVVAVFMGGLALGSQLLGRRADAAARPLRLYGLLELGIAGFAALFLLLTAAYPALYGPLARLGEGRPAYLMALRCAFAALAMLGPTTLMGGTLPVLARFVGRRRDRLASRLSLLYGLNTLGAVAGTVACGFLLLPSIGVTATQLVAAAVNVAIGLAALLLPEARVAPDPAREGPRGAAPAAEEAAPVGAAAPARLVLWGTALSGFCALGFEVLWTRLLGLVVGTSVYSFTIILAAFLGGLALGSHLFAAARRRWSGAGRSGPVALGAVLVGIGLSALAVTVLMRDLPAHVTALQEAIVGPGKSEFAARQWATLAVATSHLLVPTALMGAAFPMAAALVAAAGGGVGRATGRTLGWNTVGSILGAALTGYGLVRWVGVERALQLLSLAEAGMGAVLLACAARRPAWRWAAAVAGLAVAAGLVLSPDRLRSWDRKLFAVFMNNNREAFGTPARRAETLARFEVLYFSEGANETISVVRRRDGRQSFIVNGRPEASTGPGDVQLQLALGHLPMLLHPDPKRVFVLGSGAGMTLGATSVHPGVERVVLAEIEPGVPPATRTFAPWNHEVLDSPKLQVVFNDGRNHLATTDERFDVITADPIHPWAGGAAYLYTSEFFELVARRLRPGGVASQWLPLYELSDRDVKTVVRTFARHFAHVLVWVVYGDAVLVGSNAPLVLDEAALARRMAEGPVAGDLAQIGMGSVEELLSYFTMGNLAIPAYAAEGVVNTDDNLFLEFSAPASMGDGTRMGWNLVELGKHREPVVPYLRPAEDDAGRLRQAERWRRNYLAGRVFDFAHVLYVWQQTGSPEYVRAMQDLRDRYPDYRPRLDLERM
jgi:spermidine synthase